MQNFEMHGVSCLIFYFGVLINEINLNELVRSSSSYHYLKSELKIKASWIFDLKME